MDATMQLPRELSGEFFPCLSRTWLTFDSSMGLNLATVLAPEGVTVNIVRHFHALNPVSLLSLQLQVLPALIGSTGMIPTPKAQYGFPHQETEFY